LAVLLGAEYNSTAKVKLPSHGMDVKQIVEKGNLFVKDLALGQLSAITEIAKVRFEAFSDPKPSLSLRQASSH